MNEILWERRECVSAEVEDSLVLLDLETLVYHSLNKTAAFIWEALASPKSASDLTAELTARYEVAQSECRASVDRALATFAEKKLVTPKSAAPDASQAVPAS